MAAVLTSEVAASLTPPNVTSRSRKLTDFLQETSCKFSPSPYYVTLDMPVCPESLTDTDITDNNPSIFVTLGIDILTINLSTTVITVLAETSTSDLITLIVRSNSNAETTIAY
jgi:hypothetical protein